MPGLLTMLCQNACHALSSTTLHLISVLAVCSVCLCLQSVLAVKAVDVLQHTQQTDFHRLDAGCTFKLTCRLGKHLDLPIYCVAVYIELNMVL